MKGFVVGLLKIHCNFVMFSRLEPTKFFFRFTMEIQCPLDIPTLDKAAALPIAAATRVTDLRQYINSNLAYSGLKFFVLCTN